MKLDPTTISNFARRLGIMGATAIGTELNSPLGYAAMCSRPSDIPVTLADDLVEATQDCGEFALMGSTMKTAAVQLPEFCNELRWMSSGPRCGRLGLQKGWLTREQLDENMISPRAIP